MFVFREKYTLNSAERNQTEKDSGKKRVIKTFLREIEEILSSLSHDKFSSGDATRHVEITVTLENDFTNQDFSQ